ncbi:unnamed protein product [Lymnaea stagnalis]|uniref:G-protein coupled receptors family 1 profile domain-containing protein n=1 Tax=Lymnaea stagnalis TaxID=6523 RepID=A0AAV2I944_LYMST
MLACLDLVDLTLSIPTLLYITVVPNSDVFLPCCVFMSYVALWTAVVSGYVLVIIAVDRLYLKLCLLRQTGLDSGLVKKLFAGIILFSSVLNIPCAWVFGRDTVFFYQYNVKVGYCFLDSHGKQGPTLIAYASVLCLVFLSIWGSLVVLYYKIILTLRELSAKHKQLKSHAVEPGGSEANKKTEAMRKSSLVFIAVTVAFFSCYTPYFLTIVLSTSSPQLEGTMGPPLKAVYDLAKVSPLLNRIVNPLIFTFTSDQFRKAVVDVIACKGGCSQFFKRKGSP